MTAGQEKFRAEHPLRRYRRLDGRATGPACPITPGLTPRQRHANWESTERMPWPADYRLERSRSSPLGEAVRLMKPML